MYERDVISTCASAAPAAEQKSGAALDRRAPAHLDRAGQLEHERDKVIDLGNEVVVVSEKDPDGVAVRGRRLRLEGEGQDERRQHAARRHDVLAVVQHLLAVLDHHHRVPARRHVGEDVRPADARGRTLHRERAALRQHFVRGGRGEEHLHFLRRRVLPLLLAVRLHPRQAVLRSGGGRGQSWPAGSRSSGACSRRAALEQQ